MYLLDITLATQYYTSKYKSIYNILYISSVPECLFATNHFPKDETRSLNEAVKEHDGDKFIIKQSLALGRINMEYII